MGETTGIAWTDHTFNPWIGCTKVSQGCKLCYAETQNNRYNWNPAGWGPGATRKRTSEANWKKLLAWAKQAVSDGVTRRVFCASLADVFDDEAPQDWRDDLWNLIHETAKIGGLEWLLLTKRPENIADMLPKSWRQTPYWTNIRIGVTAEDQPNFNRRVDYLLNVWSGKNFISYEPALDKINMNHAGILEWENRINWVICGGESGPGCRPMDVQWARFMMHQCGAAGIPFFFKQMGGHPNKRHEPAEWPEDLRVQEFPK